MASHVFTRNTPATDSSVGAFMGWVVTLFGCAATLFFCSWVLASVQGRQELADWLFYAFSASFVVAMALGELRRRSRRAVLTVKSGFFPY
jgi:hypothetical protein